MENTEYNVYGSISLKSGFDIIAESEYDAITKIEKKLQEEFHLNVSEFGFNLNAIKIIYEE
jgi:hypothetical protein